MTRSRSSLTPKFGIKSHTGKKPTLTTFPIISYHTILISSGISLILKCDPLCLARASCWASNAFWSSFMVSIVSR